MDEPTLNIKPKTAITVTFGIMVVVLIFALLAFYVITTIQNEKQFKRIDAHCKELGGNAYSYSGGKYYCFQHDPKRSKNPEVFFII